MNRAYADILYERWPSPNSGVAQITLNRPDKRNPIGPSTIGELLHALEVFRADDSARVLVVTGAGKVFSAGGDLSSFPSGAGGTTAPSVKPLQATDGPNSRAGTFVDLNLAFSRLGKPSIAMVNGHALAGGLGLVLACDLAIAADDATLGAPEIAVGMWPMMITATIFRHVPRKRGLELILTGERVDAKEAAAIGLITRAVPRENLAADVTALCEKLLAKSPLITRLGLDAFYATQDLALEPALRELEKRLQIVLATEDSIEGRRAFLEKRTPIWRGK